MICNHVIYEKDDTTTLFRLVDSFLVTMAEDAVGVMPAVIETPLFLWIRAGGYQDVLDLRGDMIMPSGERRVGETHAIDFTTDRTAAARIKVDLQLITKESGTFWYEVSFNGKPVTRASLEIRIQPKTRPAPDSIDSVVS